MDKPKAKAKAKSKKKVTRDRGKYYAVFLDTTVAEFKTEGEMKDTLNQPNLPDVIFLGRGKRLQAAVEQTHHVVVEAYRA